MNNAVNLIYIITNILRIIIVCSFGGILLGKAIKNTTIKNSLIMLYCIVDCAVYLLTKNPYINLTINFILYMLFIVYF